MSNLVQPDATAPESEHGHADTGSMTLFGFWVYLMTDCILFATLFATYAVLGQSVAGGPGAADIFELPYVLTETFILLFSSITYGFAMLALSAGQKQKVLAWLGLTFVLGLAFIGMEVYEFHKLIAEGNGPNRSAFLTGFFTLVGTHGLHVTTGLLWMAVVMFQVQRNGLTTVNATRMGCLSLFWHFLDVVWICVFTVVYLFGVM
ncbi:MULTISPECIES: cytochrome o ubiquinol oxidase subunit III [Pseudomonas]|uniref:Cytochrome bo(3) ubiquinol oxidase subunit 3 n=1 Tax=Pseudomonas fluorescens (strain Q2-87) TaxID=1038922 RepID=J2ENJ1_PSEFQ|nr:MULTISPECIES: cytochrome o ubiquinol oxidase subunit III [Pseudomonas]EJL05215.1 cytochrome o ubiquinol oxidase, subunit III [Pseudomonas fluorescens Q2-87]